MRTSLKKLQKFSALNHNKRLLKKRQYIAHDELARATQDMNDMRDCYNTLLSAAAGTANSVYEFSESLRDLGSCLLEKTALNDDEESGKVLLMMGKVQFELQKLADSYRSHIFQTITIPSDSLLNELQIVEEMKRRCDEKREIYEELMKKPKEKTRSRSSFSLHQLEAAHDEYDEEANVFVFRMKSLKQGQSRSLLTQASRHHAAQMCFFRKALKSLEVIEPHVRLVAEEQHIDYQFSALTDDGVEVEDNDDDDESDIDGNYEVGIGSEAHDVEDLRFGCGQGGHVQEVKGKLPSTGRNGLQSSASSRREVRAISKSAPLFPAKAEQLMQARPSASRKISACVLPTPDETHRKSGTEISQSVHATQNLWRSSALNNKEYEKLGTSEKFSGPIILDAQSVLKDSNNRKPSRFNHPFFEAASFTKIDQCVRRQAFSGPLTDKPPTINNLNFSASGPINSSGYHPPFSGPLLPVSTTKLSSRVSPTFMSSPKISELHELPRPPSYLDVKSTISNAITRSGQILCSSQELSTSFSPTTPTSNLSALPRVRDPMKTAYRVTSESSQNSNIA